MKPVWMLLSSLVLLVACRAPVDLPREPPLDFDALPGPVHFGTEATLAERWEKSLSAAFEAGEQGSFAGVDGLSISYTVHKVANPKAAVVFLGGRTEATRKYAELLSELNEHGYSTYAMDLRGHGASDRLLPNRDKCHVVSFGDYVDDLETFIDTVVRRDAPAKLFVAAHSTGATATLLYVDRHPQALAGVVLSSPMLDVNTGKWPASVAFTLGSTACGATDGSDYALGYGDYVDQTVFEGVTVTHSQARWAFKQKLYRDRPALRVGGVTWQWLCESLTASSYAQGLGAYSPVPTLMFQAGADRTVHPEGQTRYCDAAPRCQLSFLEGAGHEVWQETDGIRDVAISQTLKFLSARSAP